MKWNYFETLCMTCNDEFVCKCRTKLIFIALKSSSDHPNFKFRSWSLNSKRKRLRSGRGSLTRRTQRRRNRKNKSSNINNRKNQLLWLLTRPLPLLCWTCCTDWLSRLKSCIRNSSNTSSWRRLPPNRESSIKPRRFHPLQRTVQALLHPRQLFK